MPDKLTNGCLFGAESESDNIWLGDGAVVLRGFVGARIENVLAAVHSVASRADFRRMTTPGGFLMSVAMTNCGSAGWVSDRKGYRYDAIDPLTGMPWPPMPEVFLELACSAAGTAGFSGFLPDACLINRYEPGAKLSLHQDKDERDFDAPIVSVSLGLPATFLFGGTTRSASVRKINLLSGDVVVWGGPSRLNYHGVAPLRDGCDPLTGSFRINLTFRKAL